MRKLLISAAAATFLIATACGGGTDPAEDPRGALTDAVENLGNYEGVDMTMSIVSTPESLTALPDSGLTEEQAQQILDSSLTIRSKSGDQAEAEVVVNVAGNDTAVEMKFVDTTLYARADVAGIMETFGQDASQLEQFRTQAGSQPGFEFVGPALDGEWIAVRGFEQAMQQFGGGQAAAEPTAAQKEAIAGFTKAIRDSAEVASGDKEGPGTHLVATVNLRELFDDLSSLAEELGAGAAGLPPESEVPDENFALDTWVDGDRLTQIQLDFTQFGDFEGGDPLPAGVEEFALQVTFDEFTASVEPPEGATEVDLGPLMQNFMGAGLGQGETTGGAAAPTNVCKEYERQLKGQPQKVVDQFVDLYGEQCPNLEKLSK
jgi:hypothetical protein